MRNPNGFGSVFKLSGNRRRPFVARKTIGFDDNGHPQYQVIGYFVKREQAMLALAEFNKNPLMIESDKITFAELFEIWKAKKYESASASTVNGYNAAFKNAKLLHDIKFQEIKTLHLDRVITECKLGHGSLRKIKVLFQQLYDYAMANDIVSKDYSAYVKLPENKEKAVRIPFSAAEIERLTGATESLPYADTILMSIYTGVRPGELLNIKTSDVFIAERYFIVTDSKTDAGKNRAIPINSKILPFFEKRLAEGHEYLISYKNKKVGYDYYYRGIFAPIMEQLGMEHRPHDTRHTFATLMNNANANGTAIKDLIGHATVAMSEKTYTHKDIEELRKSIDLI